MTQYRLDKASDTWLKYDEKADVWRPTSEGTTALQKAPASGWEAMPNNPIVEVTRGALQPFAAGQDAITASAQGRQDDNAETIARGVLLQALPVILLSLPLALLIMFLVWYTGVASVGFLGFSVGVFGLWSLFSLLAYNAIAKRGQAHSYYGVERLKVESLTGIKHQELANDYALKRAALDAYIRRLEGGSNE